MKHFATLLQTAGMILLTSLLGSCSKDKAPGIDTPQQISGAVQKGPFITGTSITIRPLNERMEPTGESYETQITDDLGHFTLPVKINASYAELIANGYYFNEVENRLSRSQITLRSITRPSDRGNNINLLTTLEAERLRHLVREGHKSFEESRTTAQREVLASFGITLKETTVSDGMDISRSGEANAALLAVSCLLQGYYDSEAELSERTAKIANDIRDNGSITQTELLQQIQHNREQLSAEYISQHLRERYASLGMKDIQVPDIYGYLDSDGDGILNGAEPYLLIPGYRKTQRLTYEQDTLEIPVHSNVKWTAEIPAEAAGWLKIDKRTTNELLVLIVQENEGLPRTAQPTLKEEGGTMTETLTITQYGKHIQLTVNVKLGSNVSTKTSEPTLENEVKNIVLIGFDQYGSFLFNRAVPELVSDTVNVNIQASFLDMNPYCRIYAIANDFDTYSQFRGDKGEFETIRTHRDVNDSKPQPRTDFKDVKLTYNAINTIDIALVYRTAQVVFDVQLDPQDSGSEIVEFTAKKTRSRSGLFFWPGRDTDPAYTNDLTVTRGADNLYTFYVYGYTEFNQVEVAVRNNDGIRNHTIDFSSTEFRPGTSYRYRIRIHKDETIPTGPSESDMGQEGGEEIPAE